MFDRWVNDLFNWLIRWDTANTLESYQAYPASNTALLLVDTQTALLQEDTALATRRINSYYFMETVLNSVYLPKLVPSSGWVREAEHETQRATGAG